MRFSRYFVHKVVPIQNAYVRKRGITQPTIYGIGSKVNQFIYILVCNYMPNIRMLAKAIFQIFCSQCCSYVVEKRGITPERQDRRRKKTIQVRLFFMYMPYIKFQDSSIRFVHKVFPIQNAYVRKRGITQPKIYGIGSKVNQFIYILVCKYMPNIRILALAVF